MASSKAGTATPGQGSKPYRAFLYGCLVHLLEHTQGDARLDWSDPALEGGGHAMGRPSSSTSLVRKGGVGTSCWRRNRRREVEEGKEEEDSLRSLVFLVCLSRGVVLFVVLLAFFCFSSLPSCPPPHAVLSLFFFDTIL